MIDNTPTIAYTITMTQKITEMQNQLLINATIAFIQEAHRGQKYNNMPYFFHPVEVADEVTAITGMMAGSVINYDTPLLINTILAALLHDVVEDTEYTAEQLRERWDDDVVDMVELLSLDDDLPYLDNIQVIIDSGNVGAMLVKLADNRVNRRGDKSSFSEKRAQKLNDRYDASMAMLESALHQMGYMV